MCTRTLLRRFVLALSLTSVCLAAPAAFAADNKPIVHVVAIGDLDVGGNFGAKVADDARNIIATFRDTFAKAGKADQLKPHLVLGKDVNPDHVLRLIHGLNVRPHDTLVVLYSGHGGMESRNNHILAFHHGELEKNRLLSAMTAKNPRLTVLLTDCCSNGVEPKHVVPKYLPKPMKNGAVMEWNTMESLFLRHSGLVDISASEPGFSAQLDHVKAGSLFTNALIRVLKTPQVDLIRHLDRDGDRWLQWDELLPELRALAAKYHREQYQSDRQQAFATSLGKWVSSNR
jgi:Caspase domain